MVERSILTVTEDMNDWFMARDILKAVEAEADRKYLTKGIGKNLRELWVDGLMERRRIRTKKDYGIYEWRRK